MGYEPNLIARSLSSKKSMILGVIIHKRDHMFMYDYTTDILSGIMDVAIQNDYQLMLYPVSTDGGDYGVEYLSLTKSRI